MSSSWSFIRQLKLFSSLALRFSNVCNRKIVYLVIKGVSTFSVLMLVNDNYRRLKSSAMLTLRRLVSTRRRTSRTPTFFGLIYCEDRGITSGSGQPLTQLRVPGRLDHLHFFLFDVRLA